MMIPTENEEQATLFEWANFASGAYPELKLLYAIPNGGYRPPRTAAMLQRTGVKPGVPDLCLPIARRGFSSLYIEMKRTQGGAVSAAQEIWIRNLNRVGNKAVVCKGFSEAKDEILKYLGVE